MAVGGDKLRERLLADMRERQFAPAEDVRAQTQKRLGDLLLSARQSVPYYRGIMRGLGVNDDDIRHDATGVLRQMPVLTKAELLSYFDDLTCDGIDLSSVKVNTSGGSTGEPARFIQDHSYHAAVSAGKVLFDEWTGYRRGDPRVYLWGAERDVLPGGASLRVRVGRWVRNEYWANTFRLGNARLEEFARLIARVKPAQVTAYVDAAYELARFMTRTGRQISGVGSVLTSAGTLYPSMREAIEQAFGAPVFNRYGSREVGDVACECDRHDGLHVNPHTHVVEIAAPDGSIAAHGMGEVLVTSLVNFAMPLIKYRIGDQGCWAQRPCSCGRAWPLLTDVQGRINSVIRTSQGAVSSAALTSLLYFRDDSGRVPFVSFGRYQIVQTQRDLVVLRVEVLDDRAWSVERRVILEKLAAIFGSDVKLDVEVGLAGASSKSGKHQFIASEIVE
jgi:phenylacetate-CoA ligase